MRSTDDTFPRDLTEEEHRITLWMIEHGKGDISRYKDHLEKATVVSACGCGCPSIDFAINRNVADSKAKMELVGDYFYGAEDELSGAFVFARGGQLAGIEFYPLAVDQVPAEIPQPDALRPAVFNKSNSEQDGSYDGG